MGLVAAAVAVSLRGLGFGAESGYQNSAEFIATAVGVVGLVRLGLVDQAVHVIRLRSRERAKRIP